MDAERRFSLAVDDRRQIVEVAYEGLISLEDRRQAVKAATKIMESRGFRRVLVDFSNAELQMENPEEESGFADLLSDNPVLAQSFTAYLSRPEQSVNWFIEILARARRYRCKHFTDREQACYWLEDGV